MFDVNFKNSDLTNVSTHYVKLYKVNFFKSLLEGAEMAKVVARMSNFNSAYLIEADLEEADFRGCSFKNANLQSANLEDGNFRSANFEGADLKSADLSGADF